MKQIKNGSKGIHKKALAQTCAVLAFIIGITVGGALLFDSQAEEGIERKNVHREDALYVTRQSGTAGSITTVAQSTIRPDNNSGTGDAVLKDVKENGWITGKLTNEEYRYDTLVVLEFTNLKAQVAEAILYDESQTIIHEPYEITDGRIVFSLKRFRNGDWYLATKLQGGEVSLGTSVISYMTQDDYNILYGTNEEEPLARDEYGGAITE